MPLSRTVAPYSPPRTPRRRGGRRVTGDIYRLSYGIPTRSNDRSARSNAAPTSIGRFPGETSCLTLVWAVLDLYITHANNGVKLTQLERQHLDRMHYQPTTEEQATRR